MFMLDRVSSAEDLKPYSQIEGLGGLPEAEKTYLFKELYMEIMIRNPKKVGLFGYR